MRTCLTGVRYKLLPIYRYRVTLNRTFSNIKNSVNRPGEFASAVRRRWGGQILTRQSLSSVRSWEILPQSQRQTAAFIAIRGFSSSKNSKDGDPPSKYVFIETNVFQSLRILYNRILILIDIL